MREITVYSLGNPGTFDITDKTDPMYYVARYSHEQSVNLYNLQTAGFEFKQVEDSDVNDINTEWTAFASSMDTWFVDAVAASNDDLPVPAPPSLPSPRIEPALGSLIIKAIIRIGIHLLTSWLRKKLDPNTEAKEIAQVLKQALIAQGPSEEYPILTQLANTPFEIILTKQGDFEDYLYADRPES